MWLLTTIGFINVVQKPGDAQLTVRARVAADLERLRERHQPTLSATAANAGTDYPFRARVTHRAFGEALATPADPSCAAACFNIWSGALSLIPAIGPEASGACACAAALTGNVGAHLDMDAEEDITLGHPRRVESTLQFMLQEVIRFRTRGRLAKLMTRS